MSTDPGSALAKLLATIARSEAIALSHDRIAIDRDIHAEAAQRADEAAEAARRTARAMIETAFPGVHWAMIEQTLL